jgi:hypothetical protein
MGALWTLAATTLAALPLAGALRRQPTEKSLPTPAAVAGGLGAAVRASLGDRNYLLLHAGFFHLRLSTSPFSSPTCRAK